MRPSWETLRAAWRLGEEALPQHGLCEAGRPSLIHTGEACTVEPRCRPGQVGDNRGNTSFPMKDSHSGLLTWKLELSNSHVLRTDVSTVVSSPFANGACVQAFLMASALAGRSGGGICSPLNLQSSIDKGEPRVKDANSPVVCTWSSFLSRAACHSFPVETDPEP